MDRRVDLIASGIDDREIARRLAAKEWERVRRGVYAPPVDATADERQRRLIEATMNGLEPGAVLGFESAAVLHRLPVDRRRLAKVHLIRYGRGRSGTKQSDITVLHRSTRLHAALIDGFSVTSLARTAVDCARTMPFRDGLAVVDGALRAGADSDTMMALTRGWRRPGNPAARRAILFADGASESAGESHSRAVMVESGIPIPVLQLEQRDRWGPMRLDFAWLDDRVAGEFDGRSKYEMQVAQGRDALDVVEEERRRQQRLEELGWTVFRWSWSDLMVPGELRLRYIAAVERARRGRRAA